MGRKRRSNPLGLPPKVYAKHGAFWHVHRGQWTRIGTDLTEARAYRLDAGQKRGFARFLEEHWPYLIKGTKPATVKQYSAAVALLKHCFADFELHQIRRGDVFRWMQSCSERPGAANTALAVLKKAMQYAYDAEYIASNPAADVRPFPTVKRRRYITDAELLAALDRCSPLAQVVFDMCYLTGRRVSDVLATRLDQLQADGIKYEEQKTGARLTVAWTPALRAVVERAKAEQGDVRSATHLIALHGRPVPYSKAHYWWKQACAAAGVEGAVIHDLRAKAITDARQQGSDPQALAGHSSPGMTKRYLRLFEAPVVTGPRGVRR